jgi:hypothetical protein
MAAEPWLTRLIEHVRVTCSTCGFTWNPNA